jgi:hypothetical protein
MELFEPMKAAEASRVDLAEDPKKTYNEDRAPQHSSFFRRAATTFG